MKCKFCDSESLVKDGKEKNGKQRFRCKVCGRRFVETESFPRMKTEADVISEAIELYLSGLSLPKVKAHLERKYGKTFYISVIWNWVRKYSKLVSDFVDSLSLKAYGEWQIDETVIRCRDNRKGGELSKYVWEVLDAESRYVIALHIDNQRSSEEAVKALKKAIKVVGRKPERLATDGHHLYLEAYRKIMWTRYKAGRPDHVRGLGIKSGVTNKVERLHGILKDDRVKMARGFKNKESCLDILNGWRVHRNFLTKLKCLGGKAPAETLGINLQVKSWKDLIQKTILTQTF
jgi:transposase-like protein